MQVQLPDMVVAISSMHGGHTQWLCRSYPAAAPHLPYKAVVPGYDLGRQLISGGKTVSLVSAAHAASRHSSSAS